MPASRSPTNNIDLAARPFCECWTNNNHSTWEKLGGCSCGEYKNLTEWTWESPVDQSANSCVVFSTDQKQVTFHPFYSSGTAGVRGNAPFRLNHHYYWELKILTDPYGTDIMVGVGTEKANLSDSLYTFISLLGRDQESYGLSYTGATRHNALVARDCAGFCRGTIVGVMLDLWQGTLQFYLNREPQGLSFYNLRRHKMLYPMICSTAAQSSMRLIYTSSWRASLLVDAAKSLAASASACQRACLPPGLKQRLKSLFWLTYPNKVCLLGEEEKDDAQVLVTSASTQTEMGVYIPNSMFQFLNGFYVDNVDRDYRLMVWGDR